MAAIIHHLSIAGVALLLVWTIISDIRTYTIPNWLCVAVALLAIPCWFALGLTPWPDMAVRIAIAIAVFSFFAALFAWGMMGGGDVKLIGALALWLTFSELFEMLFLMALIGGVVTLVFLMRHKAIRALGAPQIPYGIAIALAGLWVLVKPFLNQSGA